MTASQPLLWTLGEALAELGEKDWSLLRRIYDDAPDGWFVIDAYGNLRGNGGATWPEAVSAALGYPVVARDDTDELVEALEAFFEASDNYMPEQDGFYQEALANLRAALARVKGERS